MYNSIDDLNAEQDIIDQLYPGPDKMTYEQLLDLEENVGSVSKCLTKKQIKKILKLFIIKINLKEMIANVLFINMNLKMEKM